MKTTSESEGWKFVTVKGRSLHTSKFQGYWLMHCSECKWSALATTTEEHDEKGREWISHACPEGTSRFESTTDASSSDAPLMESLLSRVLALPTELTSHFGLHTSSWSVRFSSALNLLTGKGYCGPHAYKHEVVSSPESWRCSRCGRGHNDGFSGPAGADVVFRHKCDPLGPDNPMWLDLNGERWKLNS